MSKADIEDVRDLVEGIVYGKLLDNGVRKDMAIRVSRNAGRFAESQVEEVTR